VAFPPLRFARLKRLLGVGRDDFSVGALFRTVGIHPVECFAYAPGECFFAPPDLGFVSIL
jgi:hypothetical protein